MPASSALHDLSALLERVADELDGGRARVVEYAQGQAAGDEAALRLLLAVSDRLAQASDSLQTAATQLSQSQTASAPPVPPAAAAPATSPE